MLFPWCATADFDTYWKRSGADQFGVPAAIMRAICTVESNLNKNVIVFDSNGKNSIGLCQIQLQTAIFVGFSGTEQDLLKPHINLKYATKYFKYQLKRYGYNIKQAIAAYNRGFYNPKNPNKKYVDKVLNLI